MALAFALILAGGLLLAFFLRSRETRRVDIDVKALENELLFTPVEKWVKDAYAIAEKEMRRAYKDEDRRKKGPALVEQPKCWDCHTMAVVDGRGRKVSEYTEPCDRHR